MFKKVLIITLICFFQLLAEVEAAEGCQIGGVVYTNKISNISGGLFNLGNRPQYNSNPNLSLQILTGGCPVNGQIQYATITGNTIENCGFTTNYDNNTIGVVVNYEIVQCDLDGFIFIIFPLIGFGILRMYKDAQRNVI